MSFESHPAAAEPTQDETTGTGLDLTPALLEVQRAFESQIRQILESTQGVKSSFETDVGKLDKMITEEKERLSVNTSKMQNAKNLLASFNEQIGSALASPQRQEEMVTA